jgi:hypothetical protein
MADPVHLQSFFTLASVATFAGASASVVAVTNTIRSLTPWRTPWIGYVVCLALALVGAKAVGSLHGSVDVFIAFLNSCLLFCTAAGIQGISVAAGEAGKPKIQQQGAKPVKWLSPWFRSS